MLANEYGYQVSRRRAESWVGERLRHSRKVYLRLALLGTALLASVVAVVFLSAASAWPLGTTAAIVIGAGGFVFGGFFGLGGWLAYANDAALVRIAAAHPFQAWPCQLERTADGKRLILLLAPDGQVARELESSVPEEIWLRMRDGRGALWIAGDLRMDCLVATPGAEHVWRAKGRPYGASPGAGRSGGGLRAVEDELLRAVAGETFGRLLGN
ncbi:hypothetical protein AB0L35_05185 [Streptomyces sp. NPDC052309]|uniref:hypothetical protein n=1 Tax=Streptomyces sp. NPDC052309 TaxID=3155421 RepID=UPI00341E5824